MHHCKQTLQNLHGCTAAADLGSRKGHGYHSGEKNLPYTKPSPNQHDKLTPDYLWIRRLNLCHAVPCPGLLQICSPVCALLQALKQVQTGQEITQVASVASVLGTAYYLGQGTDLVSLPVAATLLLAAALLVANKKLQDLEKRFGFLDWQHSEH